MLTDVLRHLLAAHQTHVDCSPLPHTDKETINDELKAAHYALAELETPKKPAAPNPPAA